MKRMCYLVLSEDLDLLTLLAQKSEGGLRLANLVLITCRKGPDYV